MDIDNHQSDGHAYPSPLEGEQASTPAPRTEGPDHATQTDKVDELESKTVYLRLTPYDQPPALSSAPANQSAEVLHQRPYHNPILLHCEWNPKDSSRLAAAGTDALARIWTVSPTTGQEQVADHVDPGWPSVNLLNEEFPPNTRITAFTWASDGKHIVVATDDDQKARIDLWDMEGKQVHHWDGFEAPIVKLRCNPSGRQALSISPAPGKKGSTQPDGWLVTVLPSTSAAPIETRLPGYDDGDEPDAAWISETEFVVSVRTTMSLFRHAGDEVMLVRELKTRPNDPLTAVQYDGTEGSGCIAAATADGFIDVWDASGELRSSDAPAHDGRISVLQWQPLQAPGLEHERLLASGGEDGTIAIRDARLSDNKAKFEMTIDANPVLALSFTPDGAFIAGATRDRVLIWKVGEYSMPRAQWSRSSRPGRSSPKVNGTPEVEDQHCLCWDKTGQRLAFGVNDLLAVINFR
ncbi:WD40-repeat-containing domain protein [Coniella lustricola]|uniref:WD40-repeat-containing domain protein n=1 Tax=Coniella lustricola TaxID=2025994 RepID=A0A2T3ABN4_9PEZI|nr:WD40-repeat-containing domain protein [Coniella lustricola]